MIVPAAISFDGLLPSFINIENARDYITSVNVLLYEIFPEASNATRLIDPSNPAAGTANVATRLNSPSDTPLFNHTTQVSNGIVNYGISSLGADNVTAPIAIQAANIEPQPNQQQTGNSAPPSFTGTVCLPASGSICKRF